MRIAIVSRDGMEKIAEDYFKKLTIDDSLRTAVGMTSHKKQRSEFRYIPRFAAYNQPMKDGKNKLIEILGPCPEVQEQFVFSNEEEGRKAKKYHGIEQMQLSVLDSGVFTLEKSLDYYGDSVNTYLRAFVCGLDIDSTQVFVRHMAPNFLQHINEFGRIITSAVITYGSEKCRDEIIKTLDDLRLKRIM